MTTTRPYRKALSVEEALRRLTDAAGTQLDERLVEAFVRGIEEAADAPLPGADAGRSSGCRRPCRLRPAADPGIGCLGPPGDWRRRHRSRPSR